jgi:DNA-binding NarL/FixJ family response regulator
VSEAQAVLRTLTPDVALVDLSLEGRSGLDLLRILRDEYPTVKVLVVSIHDEAVYADRALKAGAMGYLMKHAAGTVLKEAVRTILGGKVWVSPEFRERLLESYRAPRFEPEHSQVSLLSDRELEILEHLGRGYGLKEIAEMIHVTAKTVGTHQEHIKRKLSIENTADLRRFAIRWVSSA